MIKKQMQSGFHGIVVFIPEKGFYSKSQMPDFPNRIIELCHQFHNIAKIVNPLTGTVECKMLRDSKITFRNRVVKLSWDNPQKAEGKIRYVLEDNYVGTIDFVPKNGIYSQLTMINYPQHVIDICKEYKFNACLKSGQLVECYKHSSITNKTKIVKLSSFNKFSAESDVRNMLISDFVGIVIFQPDGGKYNETVMNNFQNRVASICKEFRFNAYFGKNQSVHCRMVERNVGEVTVELPLDTSQIMEKELRSFLESGFSGNANFVPVGNIYNSTKIKSFYPRKALEICHQYNFFAQISDFKTKQIKCIVRPTVVELALNSYVETKNEIISHLLSNKIGIFVFIPHPSVYNYHKLMNFTSQVANICEELNFHPIVNERKIVCSILKNDTYQDNKNEIKENLKDEEKEDNKAIVLVPSFDSKAAENSIINALKEKQENIIVFKPKSGYYYKSTMKKYPQRIIHICEKNNFQAKLIDETQQIVMCTKSIIVSNKPMNSQNKSNDEFLFDDQMDKSTSNVGSEESLSSDILEEHISEFL